MDTSKTYIKMCEKAEKIQKLRNEIHYLSKGVGEYKAGKYKIMETGDISFTEGIGIECSFGIASPNSIWLPRQDQLQEMVENIDKFDTSIRSITILCHFARFCGINDEDAEGRSNIYLRKESLEVLWLAFVMKEKYSKVWNGEDWIKA